MWHEGPISDNKGLRGFYEKVGRLIPELKLWQKESFGMISKRLSLCKEALLLYDKLEESRPLQSQEFERRRQLRAEIYQLANIEEQR